MSAANIGEHLADLRGLVTMLEEAFKAKDIETMYECLEQLRDVVYDLNVAVNRYDEEDAEDDV